MSASVPPSVSTAHYLTAARLDWADVVFFLIFDSRVSNKHLQTAANAC